MLNVSFTDNLDIKKPSSQFYCIKNCLLAYEHNLKLLHRCFVACLILLEEISLQKHLCNP